MPRAETKALQIALEATYAEGVLHVVVDASYVVKRFRKLGHEGLVPLTFKNPDLWGRLALAKQRHNTIQLHKIKSHLTEDDFVLQYSHDDRLKWFGNQEADKLADSRAKELSGPMGIGGDVLQWVDQRTADVLAWLHQAVTFHLTSKACELKKFERPRKATKQELIQSAQDISPTHNWVFKDGTARCSWCLITLKCSEPTSTVHRKFHMQCPCPGGRLQAQRLNELGVHRSHQIDVRPGGIRCVQGKKSRPWMRRAAFQKGCPKEGRRRW